VPASSGTATTGLVSDASGTQHHAKHRCVSGTCLYVHAQEFEEKLRRGSASGITRGPDFHAYIDKKAIETCLSGASSISGSK
jgi:hypothetical protein